MTQKYESIMGLEIHVELNTKTKMFCKCAADYFGKQPNTHTCPVCLGLPGALPYINQEAIKKCIQIGLALNCSVAEESLFERKNYFYPDLAKGFQTSQYRWPLMVNGYLEVEDKEGRVTKIRINRAHQEEDTGKLSHPGGVTLIDFNRAGVPLVEVVTEPDFTDITQVKNYAKALQAIFKHLRVSNADMEKGDMRLEANISVRQVGKAGLPDYRVELKNINSFNFMGQAIQYEIDRQIKALEAGEKMIQETRGWDQDKKETYVQRVKEEADDYRYFPEPDLPKLMVKDWELKIKKSIKGKLPEERVAELAGKYHISESLAATIIRQGAADLFSDAAEIALDMDITSLANYLINIKPDLSTKPEQIIQDIKSKSTNIISDDRQLKGLCEEVIRENPGLVETYKKGKTTVIMALVGAVMKKSNGKADAQKVREILEKLLD